MTWLWVRLQAIGHVLRGHHVVWRARDCDIVCERCQLLLWCRLHDPRWLTHRRPGVNQ
jgi:hypothetical protein